MPQKYEAMKDHKERLLRAAACGNEQALKGLLHEGVDPNCSEDLGYEFGWRDSFRANKKGPAWKGFFCFLQRSWCERIVSSAGHSNLSMLRPKRFGGKGWRTVAFLSGDYRQLGDNGLIDLPKTIRVIRIAEEIIDQARKEAVGVIASKLP
jgi:hypothetical protein